LDTYRSFTAPVYGVFSRNNRGLLAPSDDIEEIVAFILSQNHILQHPLRQRLDSLEEIGVVSVDERDEKMNLAVFNAEGLLLGDH
jgi:hypothetical protein